MTTRMETAPDTACTAAPPAGYHLGLDRKIVRHCTPTLAALKCASLFTCRDDSKPELCSSKRTPVHADERAQAFSQELAACRAKLAPAGVRIEVLTRRATGELLYVYRPTLLARELQKRDVRDFLAREGYRTDSLSQCIDHLHRRICGTDLASQLTGKCAFPHEIGLFLGYPFADVMGFIENKGKNFLCQGCWKVYTQQRDAQECFCCYRNCTDAYEQLFDEGVPLECLAAVDENFPAFEAYRSAS